MTNGEAINWIINISADIGKVEHRDLWHYGQALSEIRDMLESVQPDIIHCKDCKYWMPYDWMFSEVWQSKNMDDYPEKEIGCRYCDMVMKADDFCSRGERRTDDELRNRKEAVF